nr:toxin glutamine deamidase domain-containing protein [Burkholderia diffusa]
MSNQADVISAAQAASEAIAKQIGAYADKKQCEALTAAANETDPKLQAQYLQDAKDWAEGGDNRVALHIAGGALTGGLTGGGLGAAGGAAGAGVSAKLAPQLNEIAQSIKDAGLTGNANVDELLGNLASNVLAGGVGALAGGGTGALTGASADRFNRQLSPMEIDKIKALAGNNVDLYNRLIAAACSKVDCSAEFVQGTADFRHYDDMQKLGAQDSQALKILSGAQASDPTFLQYSLAQKVWDATKLANNKATQVASWVGTATSSAAKTVANGVAQGALQTLDGLSVVGGGVGDPVSEVGQSIQQNGVKQTAVNVVAGFSDTMKAVGQGDATAVGALTGSAALAVLTDRVLASSKPGISVDIGEVVGGHSIRDVNSIYPSDGRTMNCANCAVATDSTLAGNPASALPGQVTSPADVATAFGKTPFNWIGRTGPDAIAQTMSNWGDGSRAVVFGARGDEVGHFSNVVNQGGTIRFLDGQTGKPTKLNDGYTQWFILRTDK